MVDQEKVFLSAEHKAFLVESDNDKAFKLQLLDSVDYLARNMPKCDKKAIRDQIETGLQVAKDGRRLIWTILLLFVGGSSLVTGISSCNTHAEKSDDSAKQERPYSYGRA